MAEPAASVWNEQRLESLKRLWAEGLSITRIGLEIGVSRNAVVGKAHRMGLPRRQSPIARSDRPAPAPKRRTLSPLAAQDWSRDKCRWPIGDPRAHDFHFCGDPIEPGRPYCSAHCAMAYTTARTGTTG